MPPVPPPPQYAPGQAPGIGEQLRGLADMARSRLGASALGTPGALQGKVARLLAGIATPEGAVDRGSSVIDVVRRHGIQDRQVVAQLESRTILGADGKSMGPAGQAAFNGEDVANVARRFGIVDMMNVGKLTELAAHGHVQRGKDVQTTVQWLRLPPSVIQHLEQVAVDGPARAAVEHGHDYQAVARHHGITTPENVERLRAYAAVSEAGRGGDIRAVAVKYGFRPEQIRNGMILVALERGEPVPSVMQRLGLGEHARMQLEQAAVLGPAGAAARQGANVQQIAYQYGISNPGASGLERAALEGPAGDAVRSGADLYNVAQQYGIALSALVHLAARVAVEGGAHVLKTMQQFGLTDPQTRRELEKICMDGPARLAVKQGYPPDMVVRQYGLDPRLTDDLRDMP